MFYVVTQFVMSRQNFSVFNSSLCRDLICYVATRLLCFMLSYLSRPRKVCRDFVSIFSALKYVTTRFSFVATKVVQQVGISCCDSYFLVAIETSSFFMFSVS